MNGPNATLTAVLRPPGEGGAWTCRGRRLVLGSEPRIVGILNVTPDSFYDGSRHQVLAAAVDRAATMVAEGAAVIDIGGQSTRPGHTEVSEQEEIDRTAPVVAALAARLDVALSIDTYRAGVARAALAAGAHVLNDVHGLQREPALAVLAAESGAGVVAMHQEPGFPALAPAAAPARVAEFFRRVLATADAAGLPRDRVVLDPGIGFQKTQPQNLALLAHLDDFHALGRPLLLGASRKSVIAHVLDLPADERLEGTLALTALAVAQGVQLLRVHDVAANLRAARMAAAVRAAR